MKSSIRIKLRNAGKRINHNFRSVNSEHWKSIPTFCSRLFVGVRNYVSMPKAVVAFGICVLVSFAILQYCRANSSDISSSDSVKQTVLGTTSLMTACEKLDVDQVKRLLDSGDDTNKTNADGNSALHLVLSGDKSDSELEDGTDTEEKRDKIIQMLLEKGANPSIRNTRGVSCLAFAMLNASASSAQLLLKQAKHVDLEPDKDSDTLLHMAARSGSTEKVSIVLDEIPGGKELINKPNSLGETPLMNTSEIKDSSGLVGEEGYSINGEHNRLLPGGSNIFRLLLSAGADVNVHDKNGDTVLMRLIDEGDHSNMVQLLKKGASPNLPDIDGTYPLHRAVAKCDGMAALILIQAGASRNTVGSAGVTPVELARIKKEICFDDTQKLLLSKVASRKR